MAIPSKVSRVLVVALIAAVSGCGGGGATNVPPNTPPPPPPGTPNSVVITNNVFSPGVLTVSTGATVTWTWDSCTGVAGYGAGQTCISHNVTFDQGTSNSGDQSSGTFTRAFAAAGTYPYHCTIHGVGMSGKVVVQ